MKTAVPPAWMLRKRRHDPELGERFVLLVMDRMTAALPFEIWPGATKEMSAGEAGASAAELGISPGAFVDALERARRAFQPGPPPDLWSVGLAASRPGASSRPAGA
jgi:hypothetical protein